ncbi:MAG: FHA domain-containing protein [Vicinamibacterales bacterium]
MDILDKARKLESTLARTLDRAAQQWAGSARREPLEVVHAIVEAVGERLEPAGRGTHVFPFNKVTLSVVAGSRETRARFAAVFEAEPTLQERITTRLHDAGCAPADLRVQTRYVSRREAHWSRPDFHIEFARVPQTELPSQARGPAQELRLTVIHGLAEKPNYSLSLPRINLGRCTELRDSRNRLIRTNHVAFADSTNDPNGSVSRRHAHIDYVTDTSHYRVCDDRSAQGTSVLRNGKTIVVPAGSRGIRLESGDELVLGEARVRIRII